MANVKVTLLRHCKTLAGWRRYPVVYGGNGRVRPGLILVDGKPVENTTGHFEIRYFEGTKTRFENVGTSASDAQAACDQKAKMLGIERSVKDTGAELVKPVERASLRASLKSFVGDAYNRNSFVAAAAYEKAGVEFLAISGKSYADQIVSTDFSNFQRELRRKGQSDRTVFNKYKLVVPFLKAAGVPTAVIPKTSPKYEKTLPEVYSAEQLKAFLDALKTDYHRIVFNLLLQTGLREQEAMHLRWADVDMRGKMLTVRSNPEWGFKIKDREERSIPLPSSFAEMLKAYRVRQMGRTLVIGTANDNPNTKLLRTLKRLVHNAGMNCGSCTACKARNECELWFLHKFRATYVTTLLRSGLDLRSVMQLSGHSDIESVMRYLRPAEGEVLRSHIDTVQWGAARG